MIKDFKFFRGEEISFFNVETAAAIMRMSQEEYQMNGASQILNVYIDGRFIRITGSIENLLNLPLPNWYRTNN